MQFWSKFGDSSLNGWWVMVWTNSKWGKIWFQVKFDLEDQSRSSPITIGTQIKVFCISGPNLVILAWMGYELSCRQARDWYTHTQTYRPTNAGDDNTQRPKLASGKNDPWNYDISMPAYWFIFSFLFWLRGHLLPSNWQLNIDSFLSIKNDFIHLGYFSA